MQRILLRIARGFLPLLLLASAGDALAWYDETHLAIARAAGYAKWYLACGADMAKIKAGDVEAGNHFAKNPAGRTVTPEAVIGQAESYDRVDEEGHLYGAIIASLRNYLREKRKGKYAAYHLAFCAHYVGDLSMPLHNASGGPFTRRYHARMDGIIDREVLNNLDRITLYPILIRSERDLAVQIARIANLSAGVGHRLERERRLLTATEAYQQISHSASLLKGILDYVNARRRGQDTPAD